MVAGAKWDRVQLGQLMRLKRYVETGAPVAE